MRSKPRNFGGQNSVPVHGMSQTPKQSKKSSKLGLNSKMVHSYNYIKDLYNKSPNDEHRNSAHTSRTTDPPDEGPSLMRSQSDWSQKDKRDRPHVAVPPATQIISETASRVGSSRELKLDDEGTTVSVSRMRDRMNRIDIENLIPLTVSRYISRLAAQNPSGNPELVPPQRYNVEAL